MPVRRPLTALLATAALAASGLVSIGAAAAPAIDPGPNGYTPPPVAWSACPKQAGFPKDFQCGTVSVPLDWDDVGGTRITLALTRVEHTAKRYQGVMLTNPGGPGGSGTFLASFHQYVPHGAGETYDWIGFDPRGVAASSPDLGCRTDVFAGPRPAYTPSTTAIERAWKARSKSYAAACARRNAALLPHITTLDTVRDMDAIRVALGRAQINYYGYSYGTTLGQTYATLFPSHLRRAVFDSNTDPSSDFFQSNFDQDTAFQKVFDVWSGWIARYDAVYRLGRTARAVEARLTAAQHALDRHPVGRIGGDEFADSLLAGGYTQALWPVITKDAAAWAVRHDRTALRRLYSRFGAVPDDNGYSVYVATTCNEARWPSYAVYRSDSLRYARVAPFSTWGNSWYNGACIFWHLPYQAPVAVDGAAAPPVLLIDETLDAATPYAGTLEVRRRFPRASLLAEPGGTTHAFSLSGNACVDDAVAAYLAHGTLPKRKPGMGADATCAPLPRPKPGAAASASATRVAEALAQASTAR